MKRPYGTYAYLPCNPDDSTDKKLELIGVALPRLIATMREANVELDMNSLQIWVNEDLDLRAPDPDWYADEKEDYDSSGTGPVWRIIVAIKANAEV